MKKRKEIEQLIPELGDTFDVIVAGGGPAGIGAALGSALQGARTLILEGRSFFGGVAAVAMWMPMNRMLLDGNRRSDAHQLLIDKILSYQPPATVPGKRDMINGDGLNVHPDYLRLACFELFEELGVHYRLYSPVTGVVMDGNSIEGVVTTSNDGQQQFFANVTVDATGDGDVAFLAGAEMVTGREEDGRHMPISLVFALANVETGSFFDYLEAQQEEFQQILDQAFADGYAMAAWYSFDRTTIPSVLNVNNGALRQIGNLDGTRAQHLTIAERAGIQVAVDFVSMARNFRIPGLEECQLVRVGAHVGVRDTRRLVGEYVLTVDDARSGPEFEDVVARKYGAIDANQLFIGEMKSGFAYPFRSMLPKTIDNLLVTGRCGSATFLGHAAGKSMGNMMALGQAAGVAAAICSRKEISPRQLDVRILQDALKEANVQL